MTTNRHRIHHRAEALRLRRQLDGVVDRLNARADLVERRLLRVAFAVVLPLAALVVALAPDLGGSTATTRLALAPAVGTMLLAGYLVRMRGPAPVPVGVRRRRAGRVRRRRSGLS